MGDDAMSGDRIGYEANSVKAKEMVARYKADILATVGFWLSTMEIQPDETAEKFRARAVKALGLASEKFQ